MKMERILSLAFSNGRKVGMIIYGENIYFIGCSKHGVKLAL